LKFFEFWAEIRFLVSPLESQVKQEGTSSDATPTEATPMEEVLPTHVDELASMVAVSGDQVEEIARARNVGEEALA